MSGVTLDTGALLAAERNDRSLWALIGEWARRGTAVVVPAGCLAQAWRGGSRQALLARLLNACAVDAVDGAAAREVGVLLSASKTADVIDAHVVVGAVRRRDVVVTSDPDDITALIEHGTARIAMHIV